VSRLAEEAFLSSYPESDHNDFGLSCGMAVEKGGGLGKLFKLFQRCFSSTVKVRGYHHTWDLGVCLEGEVGLVHVHWICRK